MTQSSLKTYSLQKGVFSFSDARIFSGMLPFKFMALGLMKKDAFNGNENSNPFKLVNTSVNKVEVKLDDDTSSTQKSCDFANDKTIDAYMYLLRIGNLKTKQISREPFRNGGKSLWEFHFSNDLNSKTVRELRHGAEKT